MHETQTELRKALREADWETLLPGLLAYAAGRLRRAGWSAGRDQEPSKMSVEQLVQTAVEACLDGTRTWDPAAVDLPGLLRGIIRSLTSSERKKFVRARTLTDTRTVEKTLEDCAEPVDSPEDLAVEEEKRRELLVAIEACLEDDPDLQAIYLAIIDGNTKREDIAAALGWTSERVTAGRIKLQRRLRRRVPERFQAAGENRRRTS